MREMLFETVNQNSTDKTPVSNMAAMYFSGNFIRQQISGRLVFGCVDPNPCRAGRKTYMGTNRYYQGIFDEKSELGERRGLYGTERRKP